MSWKAVVLIGWLVPRAQVGAPVGAGRQVAPWHRRCRIVPFVIVAVRAADWTAVSPPHVYCTLVMLARLGLVMPVRGEEAREMKPVRDEDRD